MKKETVKQRPLMYIAQPNFTAITAQMQQVVTKKKIQETNEVTEEIKDEAEVSEIQIATNIEVEVPQKVENIPQEVKDTSQKVDNAATNRISRRRRFVELNIEEKIKFFVKLPANVPKSTCQITTETEKYRGKILELNDGIVLIKTVSEPYEVQLAIYDIKDISIIGL
ncbi:hypothetical protein FZW96_14965 [Bacillus sp. BGMRC 2118]|nr:hypothetical protein FZW96_14965 [Bacillus sp. BGMRC 2118]